MIRFSKIMLIVLIFGLVTNTEAVSGEFQPSDQASLHALFGADFLAANINSARNHAAELSLRDRYQFLRNWVLPTESHPDFRISGEFTPLNPSPLAMELEPYRFPSDRGGELVSPVFDLLETASELNLLDELYEESNALIEQSAKIDRQSKLVFLTLIRLAQRSPEKAGEHLLELHQRLAGRFQESQSDYSSELLLLYDAVLRKNELDLVGDLLVSFHDRRYELNIADEWEYHLCALMGFYHEHIEDEQDANPRPSINWIPVARSIAMTRGNGYPATIWQLNSNSELHLRAGHHRDYLFFSSPLSGNYEVTAEVDLGGTTQMMTGGYFVGLQGGRTSIEIGQFRSQHHVQSVDPPFSSHDPWVRYRALVNDGQLRIFLNERLLVERELGSNYDPWIAARGIAHSTGSLQHIQIAGDPQILEEVDLSSQAAFSSWYTYYFFSEDAGNRQSLWQWVADETGHGQIVAKRHPSPRGSWLESILRYHRPLLEDGEIEYEFFYSPDEILVHPVLDRLAFILEPEGVGLHWCTDGRFDRTSVSPDHVILVKDAQRSSRPLPLIADNWNHMKVSILGQSVSLSLNGRLIFQYRLPSTNLRTFGFFRYGDRTMSRIRRVRMRGAWPKSFPSLLEQKVADPRLLTLQKEIADLPIEFHHDFVRDGLPEEIFKLTGRQLDSGVFADSDGIHVKLNGESGWTVAALMPQVQISGDFDIRAEFELLDLDKSWEDGLAFLEVRLADKDKHYIRSMRGNEPTVGHTVRHQIMWGKQEERRHLTQERFACWASAGCFRIVRTGDRFTSLIAPKGSSVFRVLGEVEISSDAPVEDILLELALRDASQGHIVWKKLSIRAEDLK